MPYRGIPSKGCSTCRKRKIKCDQRPGTCLNCEKASRECGGYRNAVDMMFLDETDVVSRRMKADLNIDAPTKPKAGASPPAPVKPAGIPTHGTTGLASLDLPAALESQATTVFYTHFALNSPYYDHRSSLFAAVSPNSALPSIRALYHSMVALGLASMAIHASPDSGLVAYAEAQYLTAISALSPAVSSPTEVKSDHTLLAVMILTIFETFSLPASSITPAMKSQVTSLTAWSNHVSGAAALLEARGVEQFETQDGVRLFAQAAIPLCVNCMQAGRLIPPIISVLLEEAKTRVLDNFSNMARTPWRSFQMIVEFTDFIGRVRQRQITDLVQLIEIATTLNAEAQSILTNIQQHANRQIITNLLPFEHHDDMLPLGYCHAYSSFMVTEIINGIHAFRLQLTGLIRSCLVMGMTRRPPLFRDPSDFQLLQQMTEDLQTLSDDIIASVPQYLGYIATSIFDNPTSLGIPPDYSSTTSTTVPSPASQTSTTSASSSQPTGPTFLWSHFPPPPASTPLGSLPLVRSASGCHMPWALMTVATTDVATPEIQQWAARRLEQIGRQCHVQQAAALAKRVKEGGWVEGWWRGVCPKDGLGWREGSKGEVGREGSVEGSGGGSQIGD